MVEDGRVQDIYTEAFLKAEIRAVYSCSLIHPCRYSDADHLPPNGTLVPQQHRSLSHAPQTNASRDNILEIIFILQERDAVAGGSLQELGPPASGSDMMYEAINI